MNLFGFVGNGQINSVDIKGLFTANEIYQALVAEYQFAIDKLNEVGHEFRARRFSYSENQYFGRAGYSFGRHYAHFDCNEKDLEKAKRKAIGALKGWADANYGESGVFGGIARGWALNRIAQGSDGAAVLGSTLNFIKKFMIDTENHPGGTALAPGMSHKDGALTLHWAIAGSYDLMRAPLVKGISFPRLGNEIFDDSTKGQDQSHHFTAYFSLGVSFGPSKLVLAYAENHNGDTLENNPGDVHLAKLAYLLGSKWSRNMITGADIEKSLRQGYIVK